MYKKKDEYNDLKIPKFITEEQYLNKIPKHQQQYYEKILT